MSAQRIESFVTPERYLALEHAASFKSEYISGEMIAMAGASEAHEIIAINLAREISTALRGAPCRPLGNNMKVRVRQANYLYPDLTVTCGERQYADNERPEVLLNPTAVFEILSPSTESYDLGAKRYLYQQIPSLQHYVLIRQDAAYVEVYTRQASGDWLIHAESDIAKAIFLSAVDATVTLASLYEDITFDSEVQNDTFFLNASISARGE